MQFNLLFASISFVRLGGMVAAIVAAIVIVVARGRAERARHRRATPSFQDDQDRLDWANREGRWRDG
jgi:hypothetical protein